jgi:oligopeptidase A
MQALVARIASLQAQFARNLSAAVAAWHKDLVDGERLAGLPLVTRERAHHESQSVGLAGFRLTVDAPTYEAVLRHGGDRELRRELFEVYATRASDRGPLAGRFDNGPVVDELLALRHELANELRFRNYAEAVAHSGVASSPDDAERLLLERNARLRPLAQSQLDEVWSFAKTEDGIKGFRPWDLPYYVAKLAARRPGFSATALLALRDLELALFDIRLHRDFLPAERATKLRSQVLDTLAQARREVNLLPPPPWDRTASSLLEMFGAGHVGGYYFASVLATEAAL